LHSRRVNRVGGIKLTSFILLQLIHTMDQDPATVAKGSKRPGTWAECPLVPPSKRHQQEAPKTPEKDRTGSLPVCPPAPSKPKRAPARVLLAYRRFAEVVLGAAQQKRMALKRGGDTDIRRILLNKLVVEKVRVDWL
jgi:hypothetical protein